MPFKSEKQRKYLWANEPEIARDWTDTYGSKIHKADGGISQLVQPGLGRPGYGGPHETEAAGRSYETAASRPGGGDAWQRQALQQHQQQQTQRHVEARRAEEAAKVYADQQRKKKAVEEGHQGNFLTNYMDKLRKKGIQGTIDRNKVLGLRKMNMMKGINPFSDLPSWAQDMTEDEFNQYLDIEKAHPRTMPKTIGDVNKFKGGEELIGRAFELQEDPIQATHDSNVN